MSPAYGRGVSKGAPVDLDFQKPQRCDNSGPNCLEVARAENGAAVIRDSKTGHRLTFTEGEWDAFVTSAKAGQYDRA
jgi:hypothetical protein